MRFEKGLAKVRGKVFGSVVVLIGTLMAIQAAPIYLTDAERYALSEPEDNVAEILYLPEQEDVFTSEFRFTARHEGWLDFRSGWGAVITRVYRESDGSLLKKHSGAFGNFGVTKATAIPVSPGEIYIFKASWTTNERRSCRADLLQRPNPNFEVLNSDEPGGLWNSVIDGDTIAAGAPAENGSRGAVYIFERRGDHWLRTQKLTLENGVADDEFGCSIALSEGMLLVGAKNDTAYAYRREIQQIRFLPVQEIPGAHNALSQSGNNLLTTRTNYSAGLPFEVKVFTRETADQPWKFEAIVSGIDQDLHYPWVNPSVFAFAGGGLLLGSNSGLLEISGDDWSLVDPPIGFRSWIHLAALGDTYCVAEGFWDEAFRIGTDGHSLSEMIYPPNLAGETGFHSITAGDRMVLASYPETLPRDNWTSGSGGDATVAYCKRYIDGEIQWQYFDRLVVPGSQIYRTWDGEHGHSADENRMAIAAETGISIFELDIPPTDRLYVDADSAGGDGSSWEQALSSLQDGLDQASAAPERFDEIWVAEGVYRPDSGSSHSAGDTAASFSLLPDVAIYGGFQGSETERPQRDPVTYRTILSGDLAADDADPDGNSIVEDAGDISGANSLHVINANAGNRMSIIDGFVITAGDATGATTDANNGGAVHSSGGGFTLRNCELLGNRAAADGGAIYVHQSHLRLEGCTLAGNSASDDGGAFYAWLSRSNLHHCQIRGNAAGDDGGGIYLTASSASLIGLAVSGNSAGVSGGAMAIKRDSPILASNCTLTGNYASTSGAGIYAEIPAPGLVPEIQLHNTILWNNATSAGATDPAASINFGDPGIVDVFPQISHCLIQNENPVTFGSSNLDGTDPANAPLFASPVVPAPTASQHGDLALLPGSPGLDAGDNLRTYSDTDIDGREWPRDSNHSGEMIVDLGPYELHGEERLYSEGYPGLDPLADENANGMTNFAEYAAGGLPTAPGLVPQTLVWDTFAPTAIKFYNYDHTPPSFAGYGGLEPDHLRLIYSRRNTSDVAVSIEVADTPAGPWVPFGDCFTEGEDYAVESQEVTDEIERTTLKFDPAPIEGSPGVPMPRKFFRLRYSLVE